MTQNRRKEDVLIARIDERLLGLDRSFINHEVEDHARFELVFKHMSDRFDKIDLQFEKVDKKLGTLWDQANNNKGAFSVGRLAANGVWGVIVLAVSYFINRGA